jgi:four helix bundle protein
MGARAIQSYRDLRVWQQAMNLVVDCYAVTRTFPKSELYGLVSQVQRAAASVPANIAEGKGRTHLGDYLRHLSIAHGSLMELETHLLIAERLSYVHSDKVNALLQQTDEISRMLTALKQKLKTL